MQRYGKRAVIIFVRKKKKQPENKVRKGDSKTHVPLGFI